MQCSISLHYGIRTYDSGLADLVLFRETRVGEVIRGLMVETGRDRTIPEFPLVFRRVTSGT